MVPVVDVHTHMLTHEYMRALAEHGKPRFTIKEVRGGRQVIHFDGAPFHTPLPEMFDWDARVRNMSKSHVDVAVVSLSAPSVYWGGAEASSTAARQANDEFAGAQRAHPDRIRWFATLPWQHAELAVVELSRACDLGAIGVFVCANIAEMPLTDPAFAPIWAEIDRRALPVLVHPTVPPGVGEMAMHEFQLTAPIGFTFDTSLAVARCIYDGFFERYPNLKLIAAHGGGALPYLIGRLDICWDNIPAARAKTTERPSNYMRRVYVDSVVFRQDALEMAISVCGPDNVLFGSDYPHSIGDMAGCLARVDALPGDVRDNVRGYTAQRIFSL